MIWTDDPVADAAAYDAEQERELMKRPICEKCGEHIQGEDLYELDGDYYCEDCAEDWLKEHRKSVENVMTWG